MYETSLIGMCNVLIVEVSAKFLIEHQQSYLIICYYMHMLTVNEAHRPTTALNAALGNNSISTE